MAPEEEPPQATTTRTTSATTSACCDNTATNVVTVDDAPPNDISNSKSNNTCVTVCTTNSEGVCVPLCHSASPAPLPADTPSSEIPEIVRKLAAELLGTGFLVMVVVASGIRAENLSDDVGVQLMINSVATIFGLFGLITIFGSISGAHFNPIVSLVDVWFHDMNVKTFTLYVLAQTIGGILGCLLANIQFKVSAEFSEKERFGYELWISEIVATASLIVIIHGCIRTGQEATVPYAVSGWVGGGYFFTSSSIFANPAVTIGRMFTNSFAGIEPRSAAVYICFQTLGAALGFVLVKFFYPHQPPPLKNDDVLYKRACVLVNHDFFEKKSY
jgi:glycerol uptake facilitator-like aquaporin